MSKLKKGEEVSVSIDFNYTIGDENPITGEIMRTIEDCEQAVRDEIDSGELNGDNVELTVTSEKLLPGLLGQYYQDLKKPKIYESKEVEKLIRNALFNGELFGRNIECKERGLEHNLPMGETFEKMALGYLEILKE